MKISELVAGIEYSGSFEDREAGIITDNSEKVVPGCIFVCIRGKRFDGHTKAAEALTKGAAAVVVSRDLGLENQIIVEDTRAAYTLLCAASHGNPERRLKLIGITGTNGKTTTAFVLRDALEHLGCKTGMIGTVKNVIGDIEEPASLTTPDANDLFALFERMAECGCEYCVMEVSSQALAQKRVEGLHFACAIFTNLTRDHLDYHETMENYMAAKHILFENSDIAVINADDEAAEYMMQGTQCRNVTFSLGNDNCDYTAKNIRYSAKGVKYEIISNEGICRVSFGVPGEFNVYNSMGAAVCLEELGFDRKSVSDAVSASRGVPGRMEVVPTDTPYSVIIDYAHTPDGLSNILTSLRKITEGRIIAVFGCGGDRDRTKRPIMGEIGTRLSDIAVITSDNPRTEDPDAIIEEILTGVEKHRNKKIVVEADRTKAISKALSCAQPGDVVVLAGKGHETYQILSTGKIHYDEREIVASLLK